MIIKNCLREGRMVSAWRAGIH